jgi:hypothetical protein
MDRRVSASAWTDRRGRRPQHVRKLLAREPGDLVSDQGEVALARIGKTSIFFKATRIYRMPDKKHNTLVYLAISSKLINGIVKLA